MASLLDTLIKDRSVSTNTVFSADFDKNDGQQGPDARRAVLVRPDPVQLGIQDPAGQIAAAPPLAWAGDSSTYTGDVAAAPGSSPRTAPISRRQGPGTWMATSSAYQATAGTYPAYKAATAWLADQPTGYFASNVAPAFTRRPGIPWPGWSATKFSQEAIWAATVVPALTEGKTITSMLGPWQTAISGPGPGLSDTRSSKRDANESGRGAGLPPGPARVRVHRRLPGAADRLWERPTVPRSTSRFDNCGRATGRPRGTSPRSARDFRFGGPLFIDVGIYLVIWLVDLVVFVVGLALLLHGRMRRPRRPAVPLLPSGGTGRGGQRPGLAVHARPDRRPRRRLLGWLGYAISARSSCQAHLPVVFAMIAFWTGAGGWIVMMNGALNNIPLDLIDAAQIDGAGPWRIARRSRSRCCASGSPTW